MSSNLHKLSFKIMLEVSSYSLYDDAARAIIEAAIRLQWGIFISFFLSPLFEKHVGIKKKRKKRRKYAHLLIESNLVLIVLNAIYLVLDLLLNFFFKISSHINLFLYQVWSSFFYCYLLFFFIIFLIEIVFQFIPRHLFLFYFLSNLVLVLFNSILLVLDPFLVEFIFSISSLII